MVRSHWAKIDIMSPESIQNQLLTESFNCWSCLNFATFSSLVSKSPNSNVIHFGVNVCQHSSKKYDVKSQIPNPFRSCSSQNLPSVIVPIAVSVFLTNSCNRNSKNIIMKELSFSYCATVGE